VTGYTESANFSTTLGAFATSMPAGPGDRGVFVTKLNPAGTALVYSTYLGGSGYESPWGIVVDAAGAAYVTGQTYSPDFPTTPGALQAVSPGGGANQDAFITKLSPSGSGLDYSTYLGGSANDQALGIAVDATGAAYVTGDTYSIDFPVTAGAFLTVSPDGGVNQDAFAAKLNPSGATLAYSTYLGGADYDEGDGVAVDSSGAAYLTGSTYSVDFPTTVGAFRTTSPGGGNTLDGFVTKLAPSGSAPAYSTYLGGNGDDQAVGIAVDADGSAYAAGDTYSTNFPVSVGAFRTTAPGGGVYPAVYVTKLNAAGGALGYSTYLGGRNQNYSGGIVVDGSGSAIVGGYTYSTDFPTTVDAYARTAAGGLSVDAFLTKLNPLGKALLYSTYFGGLNEDHALCVAVDPAGSPYFAGYTRATDFPITSGAFQTANGGSSDGFVTKFSFIIPTSTTVTPATGEPGQQVYITATVVGQDAAKVNGGTVRFTTPDSLTYDRLTDANGIAELYWDIPAGVRTSSISAQFLGNAAYAASTGSATVTVDLTTKVMVPNAKGVPGQTCDVVAYLFEGASWSGIAGKRLALHVDGGPGIAFPGLTQGAYGKGVCPYTIPGSMSVGTHALTVSFAGDADWPASEGSATLTLTAPPKPTYVMLFTYPAKVAVTTKLVGYLYEMQPKGVLAPLAGRTVRFTKAGTQIGALTTAPDGKATLYHLPPAAGSFTVQAIHDADAAYAGWTATKTLTVSP
jgi:hypothetical protein